MNNTLKISNEARFERMSNYVNDFPRFTLKDKVKLSALWDEFESARQSNRARCIAKLISFYEALGMSVHDIVFYIGNLEKASDEQLLSEYQHAQLMIGIESYDFNDDAPKNNSLVN